ncbi:lipopolysaccharide biosynthesis protein [Geomonas sp. Red32]|uniref:lipopolysaccharide biosynthesis protein n=1 Tax=Geomonas sp. Red32 TaxID=2912856 RepID=UPI00202CD7F5|nr:lipopolysaccharide biosynthesis protein [Geomonas sp. Red32]MCM0083335.1 lipopolysaccharide biosynthesis protein [Geomonas sp. Red32]
MNDLKQKTLRGGIAKLLGQVADFLIRIATTAVLARLLDPKDFGLVAMVTVVTGVYARFTTAGLSSATVQHDEVTEGQLSTLFWVNMAAGMALAILCVVTAPALASFYREPRLYWITVALAAGFLANAAGVQHSALLQREMRFTALTVCETVAQAVALTAGVVCAWLGVGYWALVAMAVVGPAVASAGKWIATGWVPGRPRRGSGVRPMLRFGGTLTVNGLVCYLGYNLEKVLLGRFWGAASLGVYGRAFNLINIPTDSLNSSVGGVAFAALSRVQGEPERLRRYFLKGYTLVMSMTLPITICCALFAEEIVLVLLGPKWHEAAVIFRLLAPTVLVYGMINPMAWLLLSSGLQARSLKIALVIAPLMITADLLGLSWGPRGVALATSAAMTLWLVPHILWCIHGTVISVADLSHAIAMPLVSGIASAGVTFGVKYWAGGLLAPVPRLLAGGVVMLLSYLGMLLFVLGQKELYLDLYRGIRGASGKVAPDAG